MANHRCREKDDNRILGAGSASGQGMAGSWEQ